MKTQFLTTVCAAALAASLASASLMPSLPIIRAEAPWAHPKPAAETAPPARAQHQAVRRQ